MKRAILTLHTIALFACLATASEKPENDTTFYFNDKAIELNDNNDQVDVRVYKIIGEGNTTEFKSVYKGVFSDEKNVENYTVFEDLGFRLPSFGRKRRHERPLDRMQPHWAGLSVGYSNMIQRTGDTYNMASFDGVGIRPENSLEWTLNFNEFIAPLYKDIFGLTTGFGMTWRNYCLENHHHFEVINGVTELVPADPGIHYTRSRLRTLHLNFPLLLEWQPKLGYDHNFFLTAGVIGEIKAFANYKVTYEDASGDKIRRRMAKGLNTRLLTLDYMVQIGYKDFGVFAKYSPFSFFTTGDGPDAQAVSIGVVFHGNE